MERSPKPAGGEMPLGGAVERGRAAEDVAALWLRLRGLQVLDRNRRGGGGEIDLVAREGDCLVFVEVRLRRGDALVGAGGSIGREKRRRLRACARELLARRPDLWWPHRTMRFDVVLLTAGAQGRPHTLLVEHLRSVRI